LTCRDDARSLHLMPRTTLALLALIAFGACRQADSAPPDSTAVPLELRQQSTNADATPPAIPLSDATPLHVARAVKRWPHDTMAYTQGLLADGDQLLESTGIKGRSGVRDVDRATGRVLRQFDLESTQFGEGLAELHGRLYQLTWTSGKGIVYDARTLAPIDSFTYSGEGWGLASDGTWLYLSDGTSTIRVIDPTTFRVVRTIRVLEAESPVWMINELEWVRGELWANIYETDYIARIDPLTGNVLGWIDLNRVLSPGEQSHVKTRGGVANGIAYDSVSRRVFVTGKYWPYVVQLDSVPVTPSRLSTRSSLPATP
jgi:glutamine cyclotransferase